MKEAFGKEKWLQVQKGELVLDCTYSHPVIDTFWFSNPSQFRNVRKLIAKYLLKEAAMVGHQEIMLSLVGYMLEPDNNLSELIVGFNNLEATIWSPLVHELTDPKLQKSCE